MKYRPITLLYLANLIYNLQSAPTSTTHSADESPNSSISSTIGPTFSARPINNATETSSPTSSPGESAPSQETHELSKSEQSVALSPRPQSPTVEERCEANKTAVFAHPSQCALYYNCSHVYDYVPAFMEQYLLECPYPKLFSVETGRCEDYRIVRCKERTEPKWECQYRKNWCSEYFCYQPCESKFPSCLGLENGQNPYHLQAWLPYYKVCKDERTVKVSLCPRGLKTIVFNPFSRACEEERMIPKEYNLSDVCSRKTDGFYSDSFGRCHRYYECGDHKFRAWLRCTSGHVFDEMTQMCQRPENVCGPCGTKKKECYEMHVVSK